MEVPSGILFCSRCCLMILFASANSRIGTHGTEFFRLVAFVKKLFITRWNRHRDDTAFLSQQMPEHPLIVFFKCGKWLSARRSDHVVGSNQKEVRFRLQVQRFLQTLIFQNCNRHSRGSKAEYFCICRAEGTTHAPVRINIVFFNDDLSPFYNYNESRENVKR